MQTKITDTIVQTDTRAEGVQAVYALHDQGNAATLFGPVSGRFLAIDLDAPIVDIVDALFDLGLEANAAEDAAMRLVKRGR